MNISRYQPSLNEVWNTVVDNSINGTFLHRREFIEYHNDRFIDDSLVFFEGNQVIGVFPAEVENKQVYSHRGLTYAGWIVVKGLSQETLQRMVLGTMQYYRSKGFKVLEIKSVPDFFCHESQVELFEAIHFAGLKIRENAVFHVSALPCQITDRGRKWGLKKAVSFGLRVMVEEDFQEFWKNVLEPHLNDKFQNRPVHSLEEIQLLKSRFPENIKTYTVQKEGETLAGTVLFIDKDFLHTQYIASTEKGRDYRALDLLFTKIFEEFNSTKKSLSMGTSCDSRTGEPISGLVSWKESLGGVPVNVPIFFGNLNQIPL